MRKNLAVKAFIIAIAMVLSLCFLVACGEKIDISTDLNVNIAVMNGDELLATITNETLEGVTQERVTMTTADKGSRISTTTYIAYSFKAILTKLDITVPTFSAMTCSAADGYKNDLPFTSIDDSYITIGVEVDGALVPDVDKDGLLSPRFIADKKANHSHHITKKVMLIVFCQ